MFFFFAERVRGLVDGEFSKWAGLFGDKEYMLGHLNKYAMIKIFNQGTAHLSTTRQAYANNS